MICATNNKGKLTEIKNILKEYEIKSLEEAGIEIDILEDQDTFLKNALKKAKEVYHLTKEACIADDSGLCIKELNGWPGIMTHRFLGENATDNERNQAIIERCKNLTNKAAEVVCVLVYYDGKQDPIIGTGVIKGKIVDSPRGENGFGFDSIFELENGKTLAELPSLIKDKCSARALAAEDLKNQLDIKIFNI